jgi:hypothetical protein
MWFKRTLIVTTLACTWTSDSNGASVVERHRMQEAVVPHEVRLAPEATCSVIYYDVCSGWIWTWSGYQVRYAVVFDLPGDCGKEAGQPCTNTGFWWYWRYTNPGYQFPVSYEMYASDSALCSVGPAIGVLENQDPIEGWNAYQGLGTTMSGFVGIVAISASFPMAATDAAASNLQVGCSPVPAIVHSVLGFASDCPPAAMEDDAGPCNLLMDATFSCETTAAEHASWGAVKSLFR